MSVDMLRAAGDRRREDQARGIAVPGMPLGSPGMESDVKHPCTVNLVASDGSISEYARHNQGDADAGATTPHAH
jgi:hypothetical protein